MLDRRDLRELSQVTSEKLGLSQQAVEKDFYVTQAIIALSSVPDDYFGLVFQGGTSLSKGYGLIKRLSEDVDFRIIERPNSNSLGTVAKRKKLRRFRRALVEALLNVGFTLPPGFVQTFYEGRFMRITAAFPGGESHDYLKPHVAIECFAGELMLDTSRQSITTLIRGALGSLCSHIEQLVDCVAVDETAAEKWVALTRRVANSYIRPRPTDKELVRHVYDLNRLNLSNALTGEYATLVSALLKKETNLFARQNLAYATNPIQASKKAISQLQTDKSWELRWNEFQEQMVYGRERHSFSEAYTSLLEVSRVIFASIE